jgi:hypothetical protein
MQSALPVTDDAPASDATTLRLALAAIAATLLLAALGQTIVSAALPTIAADLGAVDHVA